MDFEFLLPTRIIFGSGKLDTISDIAGTFGKRICIVFGCPDGIRDELLDRLDDPGNLYSMIKMEQEPTVDLLSKCVDQARQFSPDLIIGIGGGSALDTAKSVAIFLVNPGEITDYLEVIGIQKPFTHPSLPLITIPTTAGTGAEVTKNAVMTAPKEKIKVSIRSSYLFSKIALIDPNLTLRLPPDVTAFTGLDALTQLIEPYTCREPNPLTDVLCLDGIQRISKSIYSAFDDGDNIQARENMALASLLSGLALANSKLGAVHGLAGSIGGEIPAPHGVICACLLPHVYQANIAAIQKEYPVHPVLERYRMIGKILNNKSDASIYDGLDWIHKFCLHVNIPPLSTYGLNESDFNQVITKANNSSSMKGNPIRLSDQDLRNILQMSLKKK